MDFLAVCHPHQPFSDRMTLPSREERTDFAQLMKSHLETGQCGKAFVFTGGWCG